MVSPFLFTHSAVDLAYDIESGMLIENTILQHIGYQHGYYP